MIAGNSLWHLVKQTDAISKFVLLVLLGMSIAIWAVFLCRALLFNRKKRDLQNTLGRLKQARTVSDVVTISRENGADTVPGYFVASVMPAFLAAADQKQVLDALRDACDQEIDYLISWEQESIPLISTCAVISPLLGLLGTVWGLIHAFMGISESQMADIATVAPGIAEALTTTLAGLIVAIPAVVMVNYMTAQIGHVEQQLVRMADQLMRIVQEPIAQKSMAQKKGDVCVDLAVAGEQKEIQQ